MVLQEGDEVIYNFPSIDGKSVQGTIEFLGETIIHFKTVEGVTIKISEQYFDNFSPIEGI